MRCGQGNNGRTAVVYLARQAEGVEALSRFARSYRACNAGVPHDLVVLYKGYQSGQELGRARAVFTSLPHQAIEIDDSGFDLDAYATAAKRIDHALVCFLNTHTSVEAEGWLASLERHAAQPQVGVAGAMGSFESPMSSALFVLEIARRCHAAPYLGDPRVEYYFDFALNSRRGMAARREAWLAGLRQKFLRACKIARARVYTPRISPKKDARLSGFPRFPNPHVRTNGFMMRRDRFLETGFAPMKTKWDAYSFESGADGLTARLRRRGLSALIVDRAGHGYEVDAWCHSETFRMGTQRRLLISDNQSRAFAASSPGHQVSMERMTWGDYLTPAPVDFPDLGFAFAHDPQIVAPRVVASRPRGRAVPEHCATR